jgi:hypothetical protein
MRKHEAQPSNRQKAWRSRKRGKKKLQHMHYLMVRITPFPSLKGRDGDELGSYVLIESIISPNRFNESHK